jgi:hypothetical protein
MQKAPLSAYRMPSGCSRISLAFSLVARRLNICSTFHGTSANGSARRLAQSNGTQFSYEDSAKSKAGYAPLDARLNKVYTQLRHTLAPAEKEALKQEELDWLKQRGRFSPGEPRWTELTEQRIRELQARLAGASEAPPSQEKESDAASPDGRYVVVESEPSGSGSGREIELRTTDGETLATLYPGAQIGFKAHWSEDSAHLIVIALNRFNGRRNDMMAMAEKVYGKWESVGYSMPTQGSEISFLKWVSPDTARLQSGGKVVTMPFRSPLNLCFN